MFVRTWAAWLVLGGCDPRLVLLSLVFSCTGGIGPRLVFITLAGEGVELNLRRTGEDGADWEWYLVSQRLVKSETFRRLADLLCLGGSAD